MRRMKWFFLIPLIPVFIAIVILIGGEVVMHLWNWLLPPLFGFKQLTFWQAFGMLALCRILFGNFGGRGHRRGGPWRRTPEGWVRMTPEERVSFRDRIRARCGGFEPPAPGTKEPV
jgi:hypothetical protein